MGIELDSICVEMGFRGHVIHGKEMAKSERGLWRDWTGGREVSLRFAAEREAANQGMPFAPSTILSGPTSRVVCLNPI